MSHGEFGEWNWSTIGDLFLFTATEVTLHPLETDMSPVILTGQQREAAGDTQQSLDHGEEKPGYAYDEQEPSNTYFQPAFDSSSGRCHRTAYSASS
jgi:hypothetical protein